jgi:hypothetical protein
MFNISNRMWAKWVTLLLRVWEVWTHRKTSLIKVLVLLFRATEGIIPQITPRLVASTNFPPIIHYHSTLLATERVVKVTKKKWNVATNNIPLLVPDNCRKLNIKLTKTAFLCILLALYVIIIIGRYVTSAIEKVTLNRTARRFFYRLSWPIGCQQRTQINPHNS